MPIRIELQIKEQFIDQVPTWFSSHDAFESKLDPPLLIVDLKRIFQLVGWLVKQLLGGLNIKGAWSGFKYTR